MGQHDDLGGEGVLIVQIPSPKILSGARGCPKSYPVRCVGVITEGLEEKHRGHHDSLVKTGFGVRA